MMVKDFESQTVMAKQSGKRSSIVLPCLLGLTVAYQMAFYVVTWQKLPADNVESPVTCWSSKGAAEQGSAIAGQCAEVELFQKWQAHPDLDLERSDEDWTLTEPDLLMVDSVGNIEPRIMANTSENLVSKVTHAAEARTLSGLWGESQAEAKMQLEQTTQVPSTATKAAGDKPAVDSDHWAEDLVSLQAKMDIEMHRLSEMHKVHMEHHQERISKMAPHENVTKPDLLLKIEELQKEMCTDPKRKSHPTCVKFLNSHPVHHHKNSSEWIAGLEGAQAQMKSRLRGPKEDETKKLPKGTMKARRPKRKSKSAAIMENLQKKMHDLDEGLEKIHHQHEVWERSMASRAMALQVQMCSESHHKHNKACEHLWHQLEQSTDQRETQAEEKQAEVVPEEAPAVSADPLHLLHLPKMAPPESRGSRFMKKSSGAQRQTLKVSDLQGKHWGGKIPKVACIMGISQSNSTGEDLERQSAVRAAINAFRSQTYEGPKQLIVVYNAHDRQAAKLAKQNADGFVIKAVGARGEVPSQMALRFGAWESDSDADVVVRWDMDMFHHPDRLSMQVRALGHSGRPASLHMWVATIKPDGKRSVTGEPYGLENSMAGLRGWMEKNWHPYGGDSVPDHLAKVGDLVHLDMPELTHPPKH
jgi:hypothetical protein